MPNDELTTKTKIGIGVSVSVGVLLIIIVFIWIFVDPIGRLRHRQNADCIEAASRTQGRGRSPTPARPFPRPPSLHEIALGSPIPADPRGMGLAHRARALSDSSLREIPLLNSSCFIGGRCQMEHWDTVELRHHEDAAPAPVVGGMGIHRSGVASRHRGSFNASNKPDTHIISAINKHEMLDGRASRSQPSHVRSASVGEQDLYAIGTNRPLDTRHGGHGPISLQGDSAIAEQSITPTDATGMAGLGTPWVVASPIVIAGERYEMALKL